MVYLPFAWQTSVLTKHVTMWQKIKTYTLAHVIGLFLLVVGWFMSVAFTAVYIRVDRFAPYELLNGFNIAGLVLILIGSYFPEIWIAIKNRGANKP